MYHRYGVRFLGRTILFIITTYLLLVHPQQLDYVNQFGFSDGFQFVDFLWIILMAGLIADFFPRKHISIGSEKQFARCYEPTGRNSMELKGLIKEANLRAFFMLLTWLIPNLIIGFLYKSHVLFTKEWLLWFCMLYFVGDLVCVLFFCPFQYFILKNRCCATCRVFKWDSLMTFTPLFFIDSRFGSSLILVSAVLGFLWEYRYYKYPERFFEQTNKALRCSQCTTHMCRTKFQKFKPPKNRIF